MKSGSISLWSLGSLFFFGTFLLIGLLNLWYVGPLVGLAYLGLAIIYIPGIYKQFTYHLGWGIPRGFKYLVALLVLWGTIAVGDLLELFEVWILH